MSHSLGFVHLGEAASLYGFREQIKAASTSFWADTREILVRQLDSIPCDGPHEYPTHVLTNEPLRISSSEECRASVERFREWCEKLTTLSNSLRAPQLFKLFGTKQPVGIQELWYGAQRYSTPDEMEINLTNISRAASQLLSPFAQEHYVPCIDDSVWKAAISCTFLRLDETEMCAHRVAAKQLEREVSVVFGWENSLIGTQESDIFRMAVGLKEVKAMKLTRPQQNLLLQQAVGSSIAEILPRVKTDKLRAIMWKNEPYVYSTDECIVLDGGAEIAPIYRADEWDCNCAISVRTPDGCYRVELSMLYKTEGLHLHSSGQAVKNFMNTQSAENAREILRLCH